MLPPTKSPWLVPFEAPFDAARAPTRPSDDPGKKKLAARLDEVLEELSDLHERLMAGNRHALLVVFQGLDACGKDGTTKAITRGLNAAGCRATSFKAPSAEELEHDFLWRIGRHLPERGTIAVFNRSHYEEVLVVRVEPRLLAYQNLPESKAGKAPWRERFESIRDFERHLARNGTVIRKFWLNVSKEEQRQRFLDRISERKSHWKFNAGDLDKRARWKDYMLAYSEALAETSRPWAPWYAIPADDKPAMRLEVARILLDTLREIGPKWPRLTGQELAEMQEVKKRLLADE